MLEVTASHNEAFRDSADQLAFLHGELLASKAPWYDIPSAMHILQQGGYLLLPSIIEEGVSVKPSVFGKENSDGSTDDGLEVSRKEEKKVLREMDIILRAKMLEENVPGGMYIEEIKDGEVALRHRKGLYRASMSIVPAPSDEVTLAKWSANEAGTTEKERTEGTEKGKEAISSMQDAPVGRDIVMKDTEAQAPSSSERARVYDQKEEIPSKSTTDKKHEIPSETSRWRWRLLDFNLLPRADDLGIGTDEALRKDPILTARSRISSGISPELLYWIRRNLEERIWAVEDVQQLVRIGREDLVLVPSQTRVASSSDLQQAMASMDKVEAATTSEGKKERDRRPPSQDAENASTTSFASRRSVVPGAIPSWCSSALAALHSLLENFGARIAVGSVLATGFENLMHGPGVWSEEQLLRIEGPPKGYQGIRVLFWPGVPVLSSKDLRSVLASKGTEDADIVEMENGAMEGNELGTTSALEGFGPRWSVPLDIEGTEERAPEIGCALEVLLPSRMEQDNESRLLIESSIFPVPYDPATGKRLVVDVFGTHGLLSAEQLLLNAAAAYARVQLFGICIALQRHKELHATFMVSSSGRGDAPSALSVSEYRRLPAVMMRGDDVLDIPAVELCFEGQSILLLYISLRDGFPFLDASPAFLEDVSLDLKTKVQARVQDAQRGIREKTKQALTDVLPGRVSSRGIYWLTLVADVIAVTWRDVIIERLKTVLSDAIASASEGFATRAGIPSCLSNRKALLEAGIARPNLNPLFVSKKNVGNISEREESSFDWIHKEQWLLLALPRFAPPVAMSGWDDQRIQVADRGSIECFLCVNIDYRHKGITQMAFIACTATLSGIATRVFRTVSISEGFYLDHFLLPQKHAHQERNRDTRRDGTRNKRKRGETSDDHVVTDKGLHALVSRSVDPRWLDWKSLSLWLYSVITWHQLCAQLEAMKYIFSVIHENVGPAGGSIPCGMSREEDFHHLPTVLVPLMDAVKDLGNLQVNESMIEAEMHEGRRQSSYDLVLCVETEKVDSSGSWAVFMFSHGVVDRLEEASDSAGEYLKKEIIYQRSYSFSEGHTVAMAVEHAKAYVEALRESTASQMI